MKNGKNNHTINCSHTLNLNFHITGGKISDIIETK